MEYLLGIVLGFMIVGCAYLIMASVAVVASALWRK